MKCKTKYHFLNLIKILKPTHIFDVGSMDGADSLRFRGMTKSARIDAFEANPNNYALMAKDQKLHKKNINIHNILISEKTKSDFYITKGTKTGEGNRGNSSIRKPISGDNIAEKISLPSTSLERLYQKSKA